MLFRPLLRRLPRFFDREFGQMRWWDFGVDEQGNEVAFRAELPSFEEKDLDVQLYDNRLTIRAEKEDEESQQRRFRSFHRTATLPSGTDADQVTAT